jgi:hypothetical protein
MNGKASAVLKVKNNLPVNLTLRSVIGTILKNGKLIGHLNHTFATPFTLEPFSPLQYSPKISVRLIRSFSLFKNLSLNRGMEADVECQVSL